MGVWLNQQEVDHSPWLIGPIVNDSVSRGDG